MQLNDVQRCVLTGKHNINDLILAQKMLCVAFDIKFALRNCLEFWKVLNIPDAFLSIIKNGYCIPFTKNVPTMHFANNFSAFTRAAFVSQEIFTLKEKGIVKELTAIPRIVNPLSVAANATKLRLVLDCSALNNFVIRYRFKLDDLKVILDYMQPSFFMCKLDLKSCYHHIDINPCFQTFLGFSWNFSGITRFFCFTSLPFGLSTAPFVCTKLIRPFVLRWRRAGFCVSFYLDDMFLTASSPAVLIEQLSLILFDLTSAGFIVNIEKSVLEPVQRLEYLGFILDTKEFSISVPERKVLKIFGLIEHFLRNFPLFSAREMLKLAGNLMSLKIVIGNLVLLRTRHMYMFVAQAQNTDWDLRRCADERIRLDMEFWLKNLSLLCCRKLYEREMQFIDIYSDASAFACAAILKLHNVAHVSYCRLTAEQRKLSSTWRELFAILFALKSFAKFLSNCDVRIFTDNQAAPAIINKGSMRDHLQSLSLDIAAFCSKQNVFLRPLWISRDFNTAADYFSKFKDFDDWSITGGLFRFLSARWGTPTVDLFASHKNCKVQRFYSRFWCPGTKGVDAFNFSWEGELAWAVPPFKFIPKVLRHFSRVGRKMILLVPFWPSNAFWPLITPASPFFQLIKSSFVIENATRFIIPGAQKNLCLTHPAYGLRLLALFLER